MSYSVEHIHRLIGALQAEVNACDAEREAALEAVERIDLDLSNTLEEYVDTTGRPANSYYSWRHGAKSARFHKMREVRVATEKGARAKTRLTNAQMLLHATESGYRGSDPEALLRALYHLLMEVLEGADVTLDSQQIGLIAAVRERTQHIPPEDMV